MLEDYIKDDLHYCGNHDIIMNYSPFEDIYYCDECTFDLEDIFGA